uniref:Uncharacterized protein n=1 Tax=Cucumis sativus TaxID=3659 RepID=A0A0A0KB24_CUCSA
MDAVLATKILHCTDLNLMPAKRLVRRWMLVKAADDRYRDTMALKWKAKAEAEVKE